MSKEIRIVVAEPGKLPTVSLITGSLKGMQQIVGGYIELFETTESEIDLFCNEEGKLINMECNRFFPELQDIVCGPIIAIGHDDEGASVSLTDEQVKEAIRMFTVQYPPARFARVGNGILIDPNWDWKPDTTAQWYFLEEK